MSNNTIRIISGLILLSIVAVCLYLGQRASLIAIGVIGPFVIDEIITNFYDQKDFQSDIWLLKVSISSVTIFLIFIKLANRLLASGFRLGLFSISFYSFTCLSFIKNQKRS